MIAFFLFKCYNRIMKKPIAPQEAKIFKFRFTPLMIILACVALALCLVGIGLSIWRIIEDGVQYFGDALKSPFLILISLFGVVLIIALLLRSRYLVTNEHFIMQLGLIKNKYALQDITSLLLDTDTQKLTVYMGEEFFVAITNPEWNNDLVQAIREKNPNVEFSFTLADKTEENKK